MFKVKTGLMFALAFSIGLASSGIATYAKTLVVAAASNPGGLAVFVAQDKGFFAKNGVDVKVENNSRRKGRANEKTSQISKIRKRKK